MVRRQIESILIETEKHGTFHLRFNLKIGDLAYFSELQRSDVSARQFTVQVLSRLACRPELDLKEIESWPDDLLIRAATTWLDRQGGPDWRRSLDLSSFEAIRAVFREYLNGFYHRIYESISQLTPSFEGIAEAINQQFAQVVNQHLINFNQQFIKSIQSSLNLMMQSALGSLQGNLSRIIQSAKLEVPPVKFDIQVGKLFENLPDLSKLKRQYEKLDQAAEALDRGGFRFMHSHWYLGELAQFVGVERVHPHVRNAVITNRLLRLTRSEEFASELADVFPNSPILKRRWKFVNQALKAHQNRNYALSIPVFLAQIEGIFTDALILKGMALRVNGKLYARDEHGNLKLDRKGNLVGLHGLGQKVQNSNLRNDRVLQDLVEFLSDRLMPERNSILHGEHLSYDKAKLSVQLILTIYLLAIEFIEFESET